VLIHAEATQVKIQIEDNGPGIPEIYHQKIFEKFFRVPANNTHNTKGYGLGLSYAALVVKQNGGTISVKNNALKGCTFTLSFPVKA
jgi:two-component system phosphate regulon sensor histidine kinase PhoR